MALTNAGLPNSGTTTNYKFQYDSVLGNPGGPEPARLTQVMGDCDADFNLMQSWFSGVAFPFTLPVEADVQNDGRQRTTHPFQPLGATGFDGAVNQGTRAEVPVGLVNQRAKHNSQF